MSDDWEATRVGKKLNSPTIVRSPFGVSIVVVGLDPPSSFSFAAQDDDALRALLAALIEEPKKIRGILVEASRALTPGH